MRKCQIATCEKEVECFLERRRYTHLIDEAYLCGKHADNAIKSSTEWSIEEDKRTEDA